MDCFSYCLKIAWHINGWRKKEQPSLVGLNYALKIKLWASGWIIDAGTGNKSMLAMCHCFFADASSCIDNFSSKKPMKSWSVKDGKTHHEYWKSNAIYYWKRETDNITSSSIMEKQKIIKKENVAMREGWNAIFSPYTEQRMIQTIVFYINANIILTYASK